MIFGSIKSNSILVGVHECVVVDQKHRRKKENISSIEDDFKNFIESSKVLALTITKQSTTASEEKKQTLFFPRRLVNLWKFITLFDWSVMIIMLLVCVCIEKSLRFFSLRFVRNSWMIYFNRWPLKMKLNFVRPEKKTHSFDTVIMYTNLCSRQLYLCVCRYLLDEFFKKSYSSVNSMSVRIGFVSRFRFSSCALCCGGLVTRIAIHTHLCVCTFTRNQKKILTINYLNI